VKEISVKATVLAAGFVIVNVMIDVPFKATGLVPKDLVMVGGATTVIVALAVLPVPPFVDVTFPVVLFLSPALAPVTSTEMVQEPLAATEPPLKLSEVSPATGAKVPPQVLLMFGVAATCKPTGNTSVNATPVKTVLVFGFVIVKPRVVTPLSGILTAPKDFVIEGALKTVNVSFAALPVPPFVDVTLPVVLFFTPTVVAVTSTVTVQLPLAAIVPPLKVNVVLPAAGAKVGAPQPVVVAFGVPATSSPAGRASVKATPVNAVPVFGFVIVKVKVEVPPTAMGSGAKFFAIEGGATTVTTFVLALLV